jgi:hypothetical protein
LRRYVDRGRGSSLAYRLRVYFLDSQASGRIAGAVSVLLLHDVLSFYLPFDREYSCLLTFRRMVAARRQGYFGAIDMLARSILPENGTPAADPMTNLEQVFASAVARQEVLR